MLLAYKKFKESKYSVSMYRVVCTMKGCREIRVPFLSKYSYEYYLDFKQTVGHY